MTDTKPVPGLTPEQVQMELRLQEIFMPQTKRQRDEAYKRQAKPGEDPATQELRFVHYTSADAALKIINSKRMWMRNTNCMADYSEVQHGRDIFNGFFGDPAKMESFFKAVDVCVPGAAKEAVDLFNRCWPDIRFNTFITSVSEHDAEEDLHGRLSMWRAFGLSAARVAIVLKVPRVSPGALALRLLFSPVAYWPESKVHEIILEVMDNIGPNREFLASLERQRVVGVIFDMLLAGVICLKHEGFHEEREWRAIYCPQFSPSLLMESGIEVVAGVPQLVYKIPLDATASPALADLDFSRMFHRLIIGPSPYPWPMLGAFMDALLKAGVADAQDRLWSSGIPIRNP